MTNVLDSIEWITLRDAADALGLPPGKVRRLIEDRALLAMKRGGDLCIPARFLKNGEPLPGLRGTLILLHDSGFSERESLDWLFAEDDGLGQTPVDALWVGRKTQVRHAVQLLGV
ncbi:DNA-binding protein [Pseudoclavibacter triregionum]|nr:DNA-binding protein [Pseudoclavibacter triregionum]